MEDPLTNLIAPTREPALPRLCNGRAAGLMLSSCRGTGRDSQGATGLGWPRREGGHGAGRRLCELAPRTLAMCHLAVARRAITSTPPQPKLRPQSPPSPPTASLRPDPTCPAHRTGDACHLLVVAKLGYHGQCFSGCLRPRQGHL